MLHITGSMKTLREELRIAHGLIRDIMGVLGNLKPSENLTEKVGSFVLNMPKFKVLEKDSESAKHILRKVCTGELSPMDAHIKFDQACREIHHLMDVLDSVNL